jgi:hypothetical protein
MKRIKFLFCIFAFFVVTFVSSVETQKLSGSGKDYLQQTEQGPWFTGSCELICNHKKEIFSPLSLLI